MAATPVKPQAFLSKGITNDIDRKNVLSCNRKVRFRANGEIAHRITIPVNIPRKVAENISPGSLYSPTFHMAAFFNAPGPENIMNGSSNLHRPGSLQSLISLLNLQSLISLLIMQNCQATSGHE